MVNTWVELIGYANVVNILVLLYCNCNAVVELGPRLVLTPNRDIEAERGIDFVTPGVDSVEAPLLPLHTVHSPHTFHSITQMHMTS